MLAPYGIKKAGVQRSLDALAAEGKLTLKVREREREERRVGV